MKNFLFLYLLPVLGVAHAQLDTSAGTFRFSGYAEVYYTFDFSQPENHNRPDFFYSHNRHNEFNLNLGFLKANYASQRIRASLALAAGTYMNANYAAEPGVLKNLYEANAGIQLCTDKNLWVDAGIFASHIGFESAVAKDCWNLTRSILAENSPYFESGAKISYTSDNSQWFLSGLLLNGWQHITRPDGNNTPAFGTQVTFIPNSKILVNYSTFIGNDKPDTLKQMRYFQNVYGIFKVTDQVHLTAGFDLGMEETTNGTGEFNTWYSPVLMARWIISERFALAGRLEWYVDENEVIIATGTENGFNTIGYSFNIDYSVHRNVVWRVEARSLKSKDPVFVNGLEPSSANTFAATSLAVSF